MPGLYSTETESAKILLLGDSGQGKTGAKAALVAAGYKLRMIDTDRGFKILRSLLTDPHYPYAAYMKKHGIDPGEPGRISYIPIDVPMEITQVTTRRENKNVTYDILAPTSAAAWSKVLGHLREWKDDGVSYGSITDWGNDVVLDFDTLSTLAELAKYWNQGLNNRLGALEDDHGRDTGAGQELVKRLAIKITSPLVKCNVIATTHITRIDLERGAPLSPEQVLRQSPTKIIEPRGFPTIIGRALSPILPKYWNDSFIVHRRGSSATAERRIYTRPIDNTDAKNSVWLEESYPLSTGLAEILYALQYKTLPEDFLSSLRGKDNGGDSGSSATGAGGPNPNRPSGFGSGGFAR